MTPSHITVPFLGKSLFVVNYNDVPYIPIKPIVEGMSMNWFFQFTKIKAKFKTYVVKITVQLSKDNQPADTICLPLHKLTEWFQTISPNKVKPEIRDKVIQFQNECSNILYEYWTSETVEGKLPSIPEKIPTDDYEYLTTVRNGKAVSVRMARSDEIFLCFDSFKEIAERAGYLVIHSEDMLKMTINELVKPSVKNKE